MKLVSEIDGQRTAGFIVETEAYLAERDSACHGAKRRTAKNDVMFERPGLAYVYPIHARVCFNTVTQPVGIPSAVLIRAILPTEGLDVMKRRRETDRVLDLARGPARMCQAMGIWRSVNGLDLTAGQTLWIEPTDEIRYHDGQIKLTPRIGVTSAKALRLRYVVAGSPYVSGPKYLR